MRNTVLGLFLGVLLSSAVWWSISILGTPSRAPADPPGRALPRDESPGHDLESMDPAAQRSIRAFQAIAASLDAGRLNGVREHALAIAEFFESMNTRIHQCALSLAESEDLETARVQFRELTLAFQHPPIDPPQPEGYEL